MKLVTFNRVSVPSRSKGEAIVSLSRKGASSLSKDAVQLTELTAGEEIGFHQDEKKPEDWYMSRTEDGFMLRDDKGSGGLAFNNVVMADIILESLNIDQERVAFLIGSEPVIIDEVQYWPIITAKPMVKTRKKKNDD